MCRKVQKNRWAIISIFLAASFSTWTSVTADNNLNFTLVKLPRGIELQIPKGWRLQGNDLKQTIQTITDVAMDLSGVGLPDGQHTNLIVVNSNPKLTYASVRVDSVIPPSIAPSQFSSITAADIRELQTGIRQNLTKSLPHLGGQLIDFYGVRLEKISGFNAIITEYRRTGPMGPTIVQVNQIFTPAQSIGITLSYRESEAALWKAVIGKIRQSIVVNRWP